MTGTVDRELAARIGRRVRSIRTSRGLTVTALAERSGMSRRMVTLIELGQANPSIASLDNIADGLATTFATLVGVGEAQNPRGVEVWSTPAGGRGFLLSAVETPGFSIELWRCTLTPADERTIDSGAPGTEAIHHVVEGELLITADGRDRRAVAGESIAIPLGQLRTYRVTAQKDTTYFEVFPQPRADKTMP